MIILRFANIYVMLSQKKIGFVGIVFHMLNSPNLFNPMRGENGGDIL